MEEQIKQSQTWGQRNKRFLITIAIAILALILLFVLAVVLFGWDWTGFTSTMGPTLKPNEQYQPARTLWDVLQLLIIPIILAIGGFWLNQIQKNREQGAIEAGAEREKREAEQRATIEQNAAEKRTLNEREIAQDNQRETALQEYIDKMSELLLHENLRGSSEGNEVRRIARIRTLTILPRLDALRKRSVLQFLHESELLDSDKCIVDLEKADLSFADLKKADLVKANLIDANLYRANLSQADLAHAKLIYAEMIGANLSGANLNGADLFGADLEDADLSQAYLRDKANLGSVNLKGANLKGADLKQANLEDADLSQAQLSEAYLRETNLKNVRGMTVEQLEREAKSLHDAIMPDGSIHP